MYPFLNPSVNPSIDKEKNILEPNSNKKQGNPWQGKREFETTFLELFETIFQNVPCRGFQNRFPVRSSFGLRIKTVFLKQRLFSPPTGRPPHRSRHLPPLYSSS